jgi:hypothetical protein
LVDSYPTGSTHREERIERLVTDKPGPEHEAESNRAIGPTFVFGDVHPIRAKFSGVFTNRALSTLYCVGLDVIAIPFKGGSRGDADFRH